MDPNLSESVKLCIIIVYTIYYRAAKGLAMSPSERVTNVCLGGTLKLTCCTNETTLRWNITDPMDQQFETRTVGVFDSLEQVVAVRVASSVLNISRSQSSDTSVRLASMITSDNVSIDINGTIIRCYQNVTRVHIIATGDGKLCPISVNFVSFVLTD